MCCSDLFLNHFFFKGHPVPKKKMEK